MPIPILMPALSPTMEEGKLAKWLVKEGDTVASGDVIAEIETDKATMEVEAVEEGTVGRILVPEGTDGVAVNATIAILLGEGEDKSALDAHAESRRGERVRRPLRAPPQALRQARRRPRRRPQPLPPSPMARMVTESGFSPRRSPAALPRKRVSISRR